MAKREHSTLIRVAVPTTNLELHIYYERQYFTRRPGPDPASFPAHSSRALFERHVG